MGSLLLVIIEWAVTAIACGALAFTVWYASGRTPRVLPTIPAIVLILFLSQDLAGLPFFFKQPVGVVYWIFLALRYTTQTGLAGLAVWYLAHRTLARRPAA